MADEESPHTVTDQAADQPASPEAAPEAAEEADKEKEFTYAVKVEDAGAGTKKVSVEIPPERIAEKLAEQFKELRQQAAIPGFRPGHAPQKLIEKRFHHDVREQVRRSLVSESYQQALESNSLQVVGEPEFDKADEIQLPESGPLVYSFNVEVRPQLKLPELKGIKLKRPRIQVTDENVEQAMLNLRQQQGALVPVTDRGVETGDYVIADVHVKVDGNVVTHEHDAQLVARPARIAGIPVEDLAAKLAGAKAGDVRTIATKAPDTVADEALRSKDVEIEIAVKEIKRVELVAIDHEFLDSLGFANEQELRDALRQQMVQRMNQDVRQAMREQVSAQLLENVTVEIPEKLSQRQTDRVLSRRSVEMSLRGTPREEVEASLDTLRSGAKDEASRELKLLFILQQVAEVVGADVDEGELNQAVANIAAQRGKRPEKVKQEMAKDSTLLNLYVQLKEDKALDKIIEQAEIEEFDLPNEDAAKPA